MQPTLRDDASGFSAVWRGETSAAGLGVFSMPGTPFRIFTEGPGTLVMTTVPGILVPGMVVPIFLFVHFAIAAKLRTAAKVNHLAVA